MPSIKYLGPTSNDIDVITRLRLQAEVSGNLTPETVQSQINTALSTKANEFYLGDTLSRYVTPSALTGRGNGLITKTSANKANGPLSMSGGKITYSDSRFPNQYDRSGGKSWNKIAEYSTGNLSLATGRYNSTTEQEIGRFTINGPSRAWYPVFIGDFTIGYGKGEVCIKYGSRYMARAIGGNATDQPFTCTVVPVNSLTSVTGSATFTVTRRAFFDGTDVLPGFRIACIAVPA